MDVQRQQFNGDAIRQELAKQYHRATTTSVDDVDLLAIDLFATMVQQYEAFITFDATKIIAEKFKSANPDEVLLALNVLEECMSKCGAKFRTEVGKFRFLNDLIRLVSPQYEGEKTPKKIRDKILDLLLLWTINFPNEKKIKEAYDMLLKRGVRHETAKPVIAKNDAKHEAIDVKSRERPEPDLSAKLQRLLRSSNPADYKAANLLIQNMVKEKERRHEVNMRRKLELKEITENATVLKQMLDQLEDDQTKKSSTDEITEDLLATLTYLYESCKKLQPTILILIGDTEDNECLDDALEVNDLVAEVFHKYHRLVIKNRPKCASSSLISTPQTSAVSSQNGTSKNTMDELQEIFANSSTSNASNANNANPIMAMTPLEPTPAKVITNDTSDKSWQTIKDLNNAATGSLNSLITPISSPAVAKSVGTFENLLNNESVMSSVQISKASSISNSHQEKVNATQLKFQNFDSEITQLISGLKSNLRKESEEVINSDDDKLLLDNDVEPLESETMNKSSDELVLSEAIKQEVVSTDESAIQVNLNKALADIVVDLNEIRPHDNYAPQCIMDEKSGLKILLNFTKDKPRSDVVVLVITTMNQNSLPIRNFQFEASVTKPCKLHLQKPSGHDLPGKKPFRPPTEDITQILLISNAEKKPLKLVCIISYKMGEDPDMVKEFLEINDLPDLFN
ncbi:ADP-ribosylation factor-binding protein GGA3 [Contarinia nasturtii]|uniref:ADP-ribosylation factor-binding protein GGA3 n=1 Tax=Contarinia nasturtii TaxID=265458 RepID=UPI0012D3974C|nr:ADP-ribosylation factor-binding protein GGA3 [Contarinia nasturtii]